MIRGQLPRQTTPIIAVNAGGFGVGITDRHHIHIARIARQGHYGGLAMSKLFPSILPSGDDFVDNKYSREELERKEWPEIRSLAAEHPSDEIHGQCERDEIIDFLVGEQRLD